MAFRAYVLPDDEWDRIDRECPDSPMAGVDRSSMLGHLIVLERDGQIVGHWPLMLAWHAEPLYIRPDARTVSGVRELIHAVQRTIGEESIPVAFAVMEDQAVAKMAARLGFQPVPGTVYYAKAELPVSAAPAPPKET